jgi:hypothetical protein
MAAGLGFKTFVTGDVLTAGDTNGYLMQGVLVFASAAARTSAITSPQEGQMSYLKDTNSTEYYSGSAWTPVAGASTSGLTFITSTTFTDSTGANIDSIFSSSYENYLVILDNLNGVGGGAYVGMQFRYGSTTQTTAYYTVNFGYNVSDALETNGKNNGATYVVARVHTSATDQSSAQFFVSGVGNSSENPTVRGQFSNGEGTHVGVWGGRVYSAQTYTGIRLLPDPTVGGGSNISGRVTVYGLAKA